MQTPESHVRRMRNTGRCDARYNPGGLQKYQEKGYRALLSHLRVIPAEAGLNLLEQI